MMKQSFRWCLILALLFAGAVPAQTAWPQFRGPSGQRSCRPAGRGGAARPADSLERNRERQVEDAHPASRVVDARRDGRAGLAHHRDGGWPRFLRDLRQRRHGRNRSQREALPCRRSRTARQSAQRLCVAVAGDRARPRLRPLRKLRHRLHRYENVRGPVEAQRPAVPALSRPGFLPHRVPESAHPEHGRRGRPVPRRARQGDREDRVEDRPHGELGRPRRGWQTDGAKATCERRTPRR